MVRGLSSHLRARARQIELFHDHLRSQYADRVLYWEQRGYSRQRGGAVTIIADGMDQCKYMLPRHVVMKGKEFSTMQRIKLHVACAICHGRFCLFAVSLPNTKKDANMSVELLAHALTLLQRQGQNLATTSLWLQHDNTCREFKNAHGVRWQCAQVVSKNIYRCTSAFLRSGHTHEDIDQVFGSVSKWLLKCRDLQDPTDVRAAILSFLSQAKMPFEGERHCVFINSPRDWILDCFSGID